MRKSALQGNAEVRQINNSRGSVEEKVAKGNERERNT